MAQQGRNERNRLRLIAARKAIGITQAEMAEVLLTPLSTYEQWESGRFGVPGVAAIAAELYCEAEGIAVPKRGRKPH